MKILFSIFLLVLVQGCASSSGALSTYENWRTSWNRHDSKLIDKYMSTRVKKVFSSSEWAEKSRNPNRKAVGIEAKNSEFIYSSKIENRINPFSLSMKNKKWVISSSIFPVYSKNSPDSSVNSFIMALEFQRLDILSSLLSDEFRVSISKDDLKKLFSLKNPKMSKLLMLLKKAKGNTVIVKDNIAVFPYGNGKSLKLIREESGWCIVDPD